MNRVTALLSCSLEEHLQQKTGNPQSFRSFAQTFSGTNPKSIWTTKGREIDLSLPRHFSATKAHKKITQ